MADGDVVNAGKMPVEIELINSVAEVPQPDMLSVGSGGVEHADVVKIATQGEFKRGTVLMNAAGSDEFAPCTAAGLNTADMFAILSENVNIGENEYADVVVYISGEFNENLVIFPWETEDDNHDEIVETARHALRKSGILLRKVVK